MEERHGKVHPALEGFSQPHDTQMWLANAFFRLHRRRGMMEYGALPVEYRDMVTMAEKILLLKEDTMQLFYETMEEVDDEVLEYLYKKQKENSEGKKNGR